MVAILPMDSCKMERRSADVADAEASPTPTPATLLIWSLSSQKCVAKHDVWSKCDLTIPSRTAREASRPAIELENACSESCVRLKLSMQIIVMFCTRTHIDLVAVVVCQRCLHDPVHDYNSRKIVIRHRVRITGWQKHVKKLFKKCFRLVGLLEVG